MLIIGAHLADAFRNYQVLADGKNKKIINANVLISITMVVWFSIIMPLFFPGLIRILDMRSFFVIISSILVARHASEKTCVVWVSTTAIIAVIAAIIAVAMGVNGYHNIMWGTRINRYLPIAALHAVALPFTALFLRSSKRVVVRCGVVILSALAVLGMLMHTAWYDWGNWFIFWAFAGLTLLFVTLHALACLHPKAFALAFPSNAN